MTEEIPGYVLSALLRRSAASGEEHQTIDIWINQPIREAYMAHRGVGVDHTITYTMADAYQDAINQRNQRANVAGKAQSLRVLGEVLERIGTSGIVMPDDEKMIASWLE